MTAYTNILPEPAYEKLKPVLLERLARIVGTNPDPIRRSNPRYAAAAARLES